MLSTVLQDLDVWMVSTNLEYEARGLAPLRGATVQVFGQMALMEWKLGLPLAATRDVDAVGDWKDDAVRRKLDELLLAKGMYLDSVAHEAWMPEETEYEVFCRGRYIIGELALPEYILISKAKMAPAKNRVLLADYIASGPSELFMAVAECHGIDLEALL